MRYAIFGGSFDPPHLGHLQVVLNLLFREDIDRVMVVPCFNHKEKHNNSSVHTRVGFCQATFGDLAGVDVSSIESVIGGSGESINLVRALVEDYPEHSFRFALGEDLTESCKTWGGWDEIARLAPPIVIPRMAPISSTMIRYAFAKGEAESIRKFISPYVFKLLNLQ